MKIKLLLKLIVLGIITLTSCGKEDNIRPEDEPLGVLGGQSRNSESSRLEERRAIQRLF